MRLYKGMGDVGNIYKDDAGEYTAEIPQEYDDDGKVRFQVYRFPLEQKSLYKGMIIPHNFHKRSDLPHPIGQYKEWYSDDLADIARSTGSSIAKLAKALCSRDPVARFGAYYDIGSHHGFDNLDSYPLSLSEKEWEKRERGPTARRVRTARYGYTRPGSFKRRR